MTIDKIWPDELRIHYKRLDENFRSFIISFIEKLSSRSNDPLLNFINIVDQLADSKGIITNNSEFLFLAANIYLIKGNYEKVFEISSRDEIHPGLLNIKAYALVNQRKFDEIPEILEKAIKYSKHTDPYNLLFAKAINLLYLYYSQNFDAIEGAIQELNDLYEENLSKYESDEILLVAMSEILALGKSVLITLYRRQGNLEDGSDLGLDLISSMRTSNNRYILNRLLNNTSLCLIESGKLKDGLELLEENFKFSQLLANELQLSIGANNIGFIYRNMGNLENAMKYFYIALDNAKKAKIAPYIVATETNIAHLHLDFGNPKLALSNSEVALESLEKSDVPIPPQIEISLDLCRADIYENMDEFQEAEDILDKAIATITEANLKNEAAKVYLRKARLSARQSNLGEAKKFLEQALEIALENKLFEIILNAKLQLAEIDLLRYRMTNQSELLSEALDKISDTEQLCIDQDYQLILIDVYILQGLLLSMSNKKKASRKVLEKAIRLAADLGLPEKVQEAQNQLKEIEKEHKNLLVRIFTRINKSIRSTIAFESVVKPKTIESKVQALFIISKNTGLPFYQKEFGEKNIDSNLLSGLLSAIRTMGQTILDAEEGGLKLIDHGNVSIMQETGPDCFYALVVTRATYLLRERLREFIDKISMEQCFNGLDHSVVLTDAKRNDRITELAKEYLL